MQQLSIAACLLGGLAATTSPAPGALQGPGAATRKAPAGPVADAELAAWLSDRVAALVEERGLMALSVCAITPAGTASAAAGSADAAAERAMAPATPVRIASVTKTFVAAAALRMSERGELDLDAPIAGLLDEPFVELLRSDGYRPEAITVRHLGTHTGGLFDHAATQAYFDAVLSDPTHEWTPREQLTEAVEAGDPVGAPGERFSYSDTGYVLLGRILERRAGRPLAAIVRAEVGFERLGLRTTWWERVEPAPGSAAPRARQFVGADDVTDLDPSCDLYGGGGLLSSAEDLARFFDALLGGRVFERPETLAYMLDPGPLPAGSPYRFGLFAGTTKGRATWSHSGFWGTEVVHVPSLDATFAIAVARQQDLFVARGLLPDLVARTAAAEDGTERR